MTTSAMPATRIRRYPGGGHALELRRDREMVYRVGEPARGQELPQLTAAATAATSFPAALRLNYQSGEPAAQQGGSDVLKRKRVMRKMIPSPLAWVGGKRRLRGEIIPRFAAHDCYVEVCGGGGSVLFGKEPSRIEVYNDVDGELTNFWRVIQ